MTHQTNVLPHIVTVSALLAAAPVFAELNEFSAFTPIVEINATDGDVGFHMLIDGEPWRRLAVYDPDGDRILRVRGIDDLAEQGLTELFMESAEPPCWLDPDDPEANPDEVVTVADFIDRFEAGTYTAIGRTINRKRMWGEGDLTHALPAAPDVTIDVTGDVVTVSWIPGTDLGNCAYPVHLTDPATVPVVRWEIVVVPNPDELGGGELPPGVPMGKFTVQVPAASSSVLVPAEFIEPYLDAGMNEFKGEVGAKEASGNQTFTEIEFSID